MEYCQQAASEKLTGSLGVRTRYRIGLGFGELNSWTIAVESCLVLLANKMHREAKLADTRKGF
jgi:hypothetical protein